MSTGDLLRIEPQELQFPFELRKQISCSLQLSNKTDDYVAFEVKTTNPKKYCIRPSTEIVLPGSTCEVIVTMQAQKKAPLVMQCNDKILLQSVIASPGATARDITLEMFNKELGHNVEECQLGIVYVASPPPPSPVREGSEEGSSLRASILDNGNLNDFEIGAASKTFSESQDISVQALILKLIEERDSAIRLTNELRQEVELLRRQAKKGRGCLWLICVVIIFVVFPYVLNIVLLCLLFGYYMKNA